MDKQKKTRQPRLDDNEFYEVMPYAPAFPYSDDRIEEEDDFYNESSSSNDQASSAKMTAIVTLVLVGLVAIALALLAYRGLQAIQETAAPANLTSGYEL